MTTTAFVLIEAAIGKMDDAAITISGLPGVESAERVTGPYDIIATVSGPDLNVVADVINSDIHSVDGILSTITCLALEVS